MTIALTAEELAAMREGIAELLPDTGAILSLTQVSDGMGGLTDTWGTATASVAYRLDAQRGDEQTAAASTRPYHTYVLTLAHDATITTAHRFQDTDGHRYNVTSVDDPKSWAACIRAYVEKV